MPFTRATKLEAKLHLALAVPSGAGKTDTALQLATHLGGSIAVIDTERGSASQHADLITFDVVGLDSFYPQRYIEAIHEAEAGGYGVLIIDSLSPGPAKMAPESWSIRRPNAWPRAAAVAAKIPSPPGEK
jgi:hypothetical protein